MKNKIILLLFTLLTFNFTNLQSQVIDTTNWSLTANQVDGKYNKLTNRTTYQGKSAGSVIIPLSIDITTIDTSKFKFVSSQTDGTFAQVTNRITFYGKSAGTVVINLTYSTTAPDLYHYANIDSVNSFSVQQKLLSGTVSADAGGSNSASVTINKQAGVITVTNQMTISGSDFVLSVNNGLVNAGSIVIPVLETMSDITGSGLSIIPRIYSVTNGQFIFKIASNGNFSDNFKIHFAVFNP